MDWTSVAIAGLKGAAIGGATVLAVYLLRSLFWEGPLPRVVQRLRWVIGFAVGIATFVGMDFLGVGPGLQQTIFAAVVWGVAYVLKERDVPVGPQNESQDNPPALGFSVNDAAAAEGPVCPACSSPYNPHEYRADAPTTYCSTCGSPLPTEGMA